MSKNSLTQNLFLLAKSHYKSEFFRMSDMARILIVEYTGNPPEYISLKDTAVMVLRYGLPILKQSSRFEYELEQILLKGPCMTRYDRQEHPDGYYGALIENVLISIRGIQVQKAPLHGTDAWIWLLDFPKPEVDLSIQAKMQDVDFLKEKA